MKVTSPLFQESSESEYESDSSDSSFSSEYVEDKDKTIEEAGSESESEEDTHTDDSPKKNYWADLFNWKDYLDKDTQEQESDQSDEYDTESDSSSEEESEEGESEEEESEEEESEEEESEEEDSEEEEKTMNYKMDTTEVDDISEDSTSIDSTDYDEDDDVDLFVDNAIISPTVEDMSMTHNTTGKPYYYLLETRPNESQSASIIDINDTNPIDYSLYVYVLVNNRIHPYLLVLLEYNSKQKMYNFPTITYEPYHVEKKEKVDEENDTETVETNVHEIEINNLCFSRLSEIFSIEEENMIDINENDFDMGNLFTSKNRSIIPLRVNEYTHYMNITPQKVQTMTGWFYGQENKNKYMWCTVDEIVSNEKIFNQIIHPDVVEVMKEEKVFRTIEDEQNSIVETPTTMYACVWNKKKNEFNSQLEQSTPVSTIDYDPYGSLYYFSNDLLNSTTGKTLETIPRYVVFKGEIPLNIEEDTPNKKEEVHDAMYSSVRFKYKSTTVQGVVSPEFYYEY